MPTPFTIKDQHAPYFMTFQVVSWLDVFTRMLYRDIMVDSFNYCIRNKSLSVHAWVIMSNHVHCIIRSPNGRLSDTVRDLKRHSSTQIVEAIKSGRESRREWLLEIMRNHAVTKGKGAHYQIWTHENHAVELSMHSRSIGETRLHYLHENPVRAGWVAEVEDYLYSSARNYAGKKGLVEVELL